MNKLIVKAKTDGQQEYINAIRNNKITFAEGPAGSGKSFLPSIIAIELILAKKFEKLIIIRPLVQADIDIGMLPGTIEEKFEPFARPILDACIDGFGRGEIERMIKSKVIEMAPVGFLRGRTFKDSFVIVDEAQNLTVAQFKLILTRFGQNSKMVITGDSSQSDLDHGESGLIEVMEKLDGIDGIAITRLIQEDIVREPIVKKILERL